MHHAAFVITIALLAGSAAGQAERTSAHIDSEGSSDVRVFSPFGWASERPAAFEETLLWTFVDPVSIPYDSALGAGGNDAWVGHALNDERLSAFDVDAGNVPVLTYSFLSENPDYVGVDAAADGSLCAAIVQPVSGQITVRGFSRAGGGTPLWTYAFGEEYTDVRERSVAVSADGSRVAACAYDGASTRLVILDSGGNELNATTIAGFALSLDIDASGGRVVVTAGATARLIDTATMAEEYALPVSGSGGWARISADGTAIADGGFNVRAAREIAGVWQAVYTGSGTNDWFGAVSLSGDGRTLFAVSHDFVSGYLINDHRIVDLTTSTVVASSSFTGAGAFQNSVVSSEVNADGTLFVAATWGDQANTQPEIRVYDRDLNMIDSLDTEGSPFVMELSSDGSRVLVGSKAVHANTFGSGGRVQVLELDVATCLADTNGDGMLSPADFSAWIAAFNASAPECDQNGDSACTPADFSAWIANYNAGC